jgi:hypothetical protein
MARLHVTCINKHPTHQDRHHRIQSIGGTWGKHSEAQAIANIDGHVNSYYTTGGGSEANVVVVAHSSGKRYLKTAADTTTKDNLLSLPECR